MMKSCWDCVLGSGILANQVQSEEAYGLQVNGTSQRIKVPPFPTPRYDNENMLLLPRRLYPGDTINLSGLLKDDRETFIVNLVTSRGGEVDYDNIACQIRVNFSSNLVTLGAIVNGSFIAIANSNSDDHISDSNFAVTFRVEEGMINVDVGLSFLGTVSLTENHSLDQIRCLTLSGDIESVQELQFQFAS